MSGDDRTPALSVVVALIANRAERLARCLEALRGQETPEPFEVLVPYDAAADPTATLRERFPEARFLPVQGLDTARAARGATREQHDTLRTVGLRAARGAAVALTEDHAYAAPNWCSELLRALDERPRAGAVGGAVDCGSPRLLARAVWFCDFGRYQSPVPDGPSLFVSDSNVVYRRTALERVAASWADDYHETVVHDALRAAGFELHLTPRTLVWQARDGLTLGRALRERFVWGRSFAGSRVRGRRAPAGRLLLAALSPALPVVLSARLLGVTLRRRRQMRALLLAFPLILLLHAAWAVGEAIGYATGQP